MSLTSLAIMNGKLGIVGFGGGVTGLFYHELVVRRRVMTENEFLSSLPVAQIAPGANVVNLAVYFGQKFQGAAGAIVSVISLLTGPFFVIIGLYTIYDQISGISWVGAGVKGITAAAIGILATVVLRAVAASRTNYISHAILLITMVLVGIVRLPLIPVILCVAPVSIALAAYRMRADD